MKPRVTEQICYDEKKNIFINKQSFIYYLHTQIFRWLQSVCSDIGLVNIVNFIIINNFVQWMLVFLFNFEKWHWRPWKWHLNNLQVKTTNIKSTTPPFLRITNGVLINGPIAQSKHPSNYKISHAISHAKYHLANLIS